jgi:hypothetical protein
MSSAGSLQNLPPREMSPSPTFRDRQRVAKTQMPLTSSVMQMYQSSNQPRQQPSPPISNGSHPPRRSSPPPSSQIGSSGIQLNARDVSPERLTPPPIHTHSQNSIHQSFTAPPQPQHSHSLPNIHVHNPQIGYPRPINRIPPPQFLTSFRPMDENWTMTDELMAEIERADMQQVAAGTAGVAYAGGAGSSGISFARVESGSPSKDQGLERNRVERTSPKDVDANQGSGGSSGRRQGRADRDREQALARESPKNRDRQAHPQTTSPAFTQPQTPERRASPSYHTPLGSPGENTATYTQYKRESYPPHTRIPTPPLLRRSSNAQVADLSAATARTTPPVAIKHAIHTPPLQAIKTRSPDRSLPVQEEPEEDVAVSKQNGTRDKWKGNDHVHHENDAIGDDLRRMGSPTPSSDLHPEGHTSRFDNHGGVDNRASHREDDDETLIEQGTVGRKHDDSRDSGEEGFTPRSPSTTLPNDSQARIFAPNSSTWQPIRVKNRIGATDQLGLRGFETAVGVLPKTSTRSPAPSRPVETEQSRRHSQQPLQQPQPPPPPPQYNRSEQGHVQYQPPPIQPFDELQSFFDDPTSAYLRAYLQSPRPNAPIPPTPNSQTAAPSPSPLLSGMQSIPPYSPVPPVGSPYPFPFSHVRRPLAYSGSANRLAPSSNYDPNHPSAIQEQLALQLQVYAMNNNRAPMSESTLSPSSTPFQPPGYNPWAFLHTNRTFGTRHPDPLTSLQSSPSHEPLPLPLPPTTGRAVKKRRRSTNLRKQVGAGQPPPRVESTQPRETSPEPSSSSGEETAGDERFDGNWANGVVHDDSGDWIDEDAAVDDEDLLELEYHPSFISNIEKRRRRWETRWEALIEAVSY